MDEQGNEPKMKIPKTPERFPLNPGIKNIGKSRPEKSRDLGIWKDPIPENPGIEILDPARACSLPTLSRVFVLIQQNGKVSLRKIFL